MMVSKTLSEVVMAEIEALFVVFLMLGFLMVEFQFWFFVVMFFMLLYVHWNLLLDDYWYLDRVRLGDMNFDGIGLGYVDSVRHRDWYFDMDLHWKNIILPFNCKSTRQANGPTR